MSDLEQTLAVLRTITTTADLATAISLIPDDWNVALLGPSTTGPREAHAAIVPAGLPSTHMLVRRHEERGLMFGRGETRHQALLRAAEHATRALERKMNAA